jgi:hypothetical protein
MHLREQGGAGGPPAPLPDGLHYCRLCGGVAGRVGEIKSTCLCEGIACRHCGIGRVERPTSDQYVPATGRFMHSPYSMGMGGCRDCVITVYGAVPEGPYSWPGPLSESPTLGALVDTIKEAGLALGADRSLPLRQGIERLPRKPGLYALYGEARAWDLLGLEKPPDDRPLCVGRAGGLLPTALRGRDHLRAAVWEGGGCNLQRLERELSRRWQPPLR